MFIAELARLKTEYVRLPEKDQSFALSLLRQQTSRGLSAKQWPWVKKLVAAYESDEVRKYIDTQFKGAIIPAF